jgi:hypothetical protein
MERGVSRWKSQRVDLSESGGCALHSGLSTDPRTPEGQRRTTVDG